MEPIDIICMEMDDITKSGITNSEIFFLESGDVESVLTRIKNTIKKIIDKFIEGIKKIMGKSDDDKLKAAVRDIPELKNEKIEISDTAKRDKAYDMLENDIKKAKTVSDVDKVKEKSSKFNAKAVAITVSVAAAATIAVVVLPKRIKTFQDRSELSMKIDKELINEANKRGQRVDDLTDRMNKEIQNIKKDSLLNSEDKKKEISKVKSIYEEKIREIKSSAPFKTLASVEDKGYAYTKILSKFSQEELQTLNSEHMMISKKVDDLAKKHGYEYEPSKKKFVKNKQFINTLKTAKRIAPSDF